MSNEIVIKATDQHGNQVSLADLSMETIGKLRDKCKPIRVPEGIRIVKQCNDLGIVNPSGQVLSKGKTNSKVYGVYTNIRDFDITPCKLTPCSRSDLKVGDVAYMTDQIVDFDRLCRYCLILPDNDYVRWSNKSATVDRCLWNYHWKVEPI